MIQLDGYYEFYSLLRKKVLESGCDCYIYNTSVDESFNYEDNVRDRKCENFYVPFYFNMSQFQQLITSEFRKEGKCEEELLIGLDWPSDENGGDYERIFIVNV